MTVRTAACCCSQLRITCEGEPIRISMCHCLECQRRTGSTYGVQARWPTVRTAVEGHAAEYVRIGDEGNRITFRFCPYCGSTVYWTLSGVPDAVAVAAGAFADPALPPPTVSVYDSRRHPWVSVPDGVQRL